MIDTFNNSTKNVSVASQTQLLQLHGELEPTTPHHQALQTSPVAFELKRHRLLQELNLYRSFHSPSTDFRAIYSDGRTSWFLSVLHSKSQGSKGRLMCLG